MDNSKDAMPKKESRLLEHIGIIVAIIISISSFIYTCSKDQKDEKESIALIFTQYGTNNIELFSEVPFSAVDISGVVATNYGVIIANNSKRIVSIVEADIELLNDKGIRTFTEMFEGIYSSNFKKVQMPLVLDSGDSKQLIIRVKNGIPNKVIAEIKKNHKLPIEIEFRKIKNELAKVGMDIFGNNVVTYKLGDIDFITIPEPKYPRYLLKLKTSNKLTFQEIISVDRYNE